MAPLVPIDQSAVSQLRAKVLFCSHGLISISLSLAAQYHAYLAVSHTTVPVTAGYKQTGHNQALVSQPSTTPTWLEKAHFMQAWGFTHNLVTQPLTQQLHPSTGHSS